MTNIFPRGMPGGSANQARSPKAEWLSAQTLKSNPFWVYKPGRILLGQIEDQLIGIEDNRHLFTVAGSRAGKGVSAIVPNLKTYPGSVLVLDPKGENANLTAKDRQAKFGQAVYVLDPFRITDPDKVPDELLAGFDPVGRLNPESLRFVDDCANIADALIVASSGERTDHFNNTGRMVLSGFMAFAATEIDPRYRTLREATEPLFGSLVLAGYDSSLNEAQSQAFDTILRAMMVDEERGGSLPANAARLIASTGENERGSILSTIRQNLSFLQSPPMMNCLSGAARQPDLDRWKYQPTSIYLCLPASLLHAHFRFFRLFLNQLLAAVERYPEPPALPALMFLDEMHVLGHMEMLETAAGLFAGYGVRLWSFWQDLSQLQAIYDKRWETFIGNSGVMTAFGNTDLTTLRYLSELLGQTPYTIKEGNLRTPRETDTGHFGQHSRQQLGELLTPNELAQRYSREQETQLVLAAGKPPAEMKRILHWRDMT